MSNPSEDGLDKEGQEVLAELESEGYEIAGREEQPADPVENPTPDPAEAKPQEEQKTKEDTDTPDSQKPDPSSEKSDEPGEGNKTEDEGKKSEPRKAQYVPLSKYLETETKLKEAQALLAKNGNGDEPTQKQVDEAKDTIEKDAVQKLVEMGYEEDEAKRLASVVQAIVPGQTLPKEVQQQLSQLGELLEKTANDADALQFEKDFSGSVLSEFPHLDKFKQDIHDMAYTAEYQGTPLRTIALQYMHDNGISTRPGSVKTVERGGGGSQKETSTVDFENITEEQFVNLSPEDQDKFLAFQESKERRARGTLN